MQEPGQPSSVSVQRHPPERGLTHALYGGGCCTTCCCCCCCCAHTVGGLAGAVVGSFVMPARPGQAPASRRASKRYWATLGVSVLIFSAISFVGGPLGPLAVVLVLPALQLVASLVELVRIQKEPPEDRAALRHRLGWITGWTLAGTAAGGVVMWRMFQ